jgi:hypothetical protein
MTEISEGQSSIQPFEVAASQPASSGNQSQDERWVKAAVVCPPLSMRREAPRTQFLSATRRPIGNAIRRVTQHPAVGLHQRVRGLLSPLARLLVEKGFRPIAEAYSRVPEGVAVETRTLLQEGEIDPRFDPTGPLLIGGDDPARIDHSPLIDGTQFGQTVRQMEALARSLNEDERTLFGRIRRLAAMAGYGAPEDLETVYFALYKQGLLTVRELELMVIGGASVNMRAAAVLALGDAFSTQIKAGKTPDIAILKRRLFEPAIRRQAVQAVFKAYLAYAQRGREPDWEFMRKIIYPWTDQTMFELTEEGVKSVCVAWVQHGGDVPVDFLEGLQHETIDAEVRNLGLSVSEVVGAAKQSQMSGETRIDDECKHIDLPPKLDESAIASLQMIVGLLGNGTEAEKKATFATLARHCAAQIDAGALSEVDWRDGIWKRDVLPHASAWGPALEGWYEQTPEPTLFAMNAKFGLHLKSVKKYAMTPGFARFFASEDFLNSSILKAFLGYIEGFTAPASKESPYLQLTLALPGEVLWQGDVANVLVMGGVQKDMLYLDPMLFLEGSRSSTGNFVAIQAPLSNAQVWELDGQQIVTSQAGFVVRNDRWFLVYFNEINPISFDYVIGGFRTAHRTAFARALDLLLPELKEMGIPCRGSSEYVNLKDLTLGLLEAGGVAIPETLSFWTAKERLSDAAQHIRESLPNEIPMDGMSYADVLRIVRRFMAAHQIREVVVKPADGLQGSEVSFFRGVDYVGIPKGVAAMVLYFRAQGRSVVIQRKIQSVMLNDDGQRRDWNVRVWVAPGEGDQVTVGGYVVRLGRDWDAVNFSRGASAITLDELIERLSKQYPHLEPELTTLEERVAQISVAAYRVLADAIRRGSPQKAGEDLLSFMGADVMVALRGNHLVPQIIEMNGASSGGMGSLAEHLLRRGEDDPLYRKYRGGFLAVEQYVRAIVQRAREYRSAE